MSFPVKTETFFQSVRRAFPFLAFPFPVFFLLFFFLLFSHGIQRIVSFSDSIFWPNPLPLSASQGFLRRLSVFRLHMPNNIRIYRWKALFALGERKKYNFHSRSFVIVTDGVFPMLRWPWSPSPVALLLRTHPAFPVESARPFRV